MREQRDAHRLDAGMHHGQSLGEVSASTSRTASSAEELLVRRIKVTDAAAAGPSSSMEALAVAMPVRSAAAVWKFSSASGRPWEISGW